MLPQVAFFCVSQSLRDLFAFNERHYQQAHRESAEDETDTQELEQGDEVNLAVIVVGAISTKAFKILTEEAIHQQRDHIENGKDDEYK